MRKSFIFVFALLLFIPEPARAFRIAKPSTKKIEKTPYKARWVSTVRKGSFFKYKRKEFSSPRIFKDWIFVGSDAGSFYAMRKKSGGKIWRFDAQGSINAAPSFWEAGDESLVFIGDDKGFLYALSVKEGKEVWRQNLGSEIVSPAVVSGDRLFVSTLEGKVVAIDLARGLPRDLKDAKLGNILWEKDYPLQTSSMTIRGNAAPVVDEKSEKLYVGFGDGTLRVLSTKEGKLLWEKSYAGDNEKKGFVDIDGAPVLDGDRLYLATFDGGIFAVSRKNGEILWSRDMGSAVNLSLAGDMLYVSGSNAHVYSLSRKDGSTKWETPVGEGALTSPVLHDAILAVGISRGTINFLSTGDGHVIARRFAKKGISSDPLVEEDKIYYLSNGGRLYSLKFQK